MKVYKIKSWFIASLFVCLVTFSAINMAKKEVHNKMLVDSLVVENDSLVGEVQTVKGEISTLSDTTYLVVVIKPDNVNQSPLSRRDINRISQQIVESIEADSVLVDSILRKAHVKNLIVTWTN